MTGLVQLGMVKYGGVLCQSGWGIFGGFAFLSAARKREDAEIL